MENEDLLDFTNTEEWPDYKIALWVNSLRFEQQRRQTAADAEKEVENLLNQYAKATGLRPKVVWSEPSPQPGIQTPPWDGKAQFYRARDLVEYKGSEFRAKRAHISRPNRPPNVYPELWEPVASSSSSSPGRPSNI